MTEFHYKEFCWTDSSGSLEIIIPGSVIESVCRSGDNEAAILDALENNRTIKYELSELSASSIFDVLSEYGAWTDEELSDWRQNKVRLLWIACWDCYDNPTMYSMY